MYFILALLGLLGTGYTWWRLRRLEFRRGVRELACYLVALFEWLFCAMLETLPYGKEWKILWSQLEYFGYTATPVFLVAFVLRYSGLVQYFSVRKAWPLALVPLATLVGAWTNSWHGWIWPWFGAGLDGTIVYGHGWLYYLFSAYYFVCVLLTLAVFFMMAVRYRGVTRQALILMFGMSLPWWAGILYVANWNPLPGYDIVSVSAGIASLSILAAIRWGGLFRREPLEASQLLDIFSEQYYLVFSPELRLLDASPAALERLELDATSVKAGGLHADDVLVQCPELGDFLKTHQGKRAYRQMPHYRAHLCPLQGSPSTLLRFECMPTTSPRRISASEPSEVPLAARFRTLFEEQKAYLDPELDVAGLCEKLHTNRTTLSRLIREQYGETLTPLINRHRMQEYERLSKEPCGAALTVEARALACGFSSRSQFYSIQRELAPLEPGQAE